MRKFEFVNHNQFTQDFTYEFPNLSKDASKIYGNLTLPQRATSYSAGYDFVSPIDFNLKPGEAIKLPTGIKVIMPHSEFLLILPRSGQGFKYFLRLANTSAVIDADYQYAKNDGHIWIKIRNEGIDKMLEVKAGQAIAQGIFLDYKTVDGDLTLVQRVGGFGSTG
jgi:dUTP pyrophosphatase